MPLVVPAEGMMQLEATYHFGLPLASYVYHAAKRTLRRCVKSIPHPDSPEFHHKPLSAPGAFAEPIGASGAVHTVDPGTVARHWTLELLNASVPVLPTPRQNVAPAMPLAA